MCEEISWGGFGQACLVVVVVEWDVSFLGQEEDRAVSSKTRLA